MRSKNRYNMGYNSKVSGTLKYTYEPDEGEGPIETATAIEYLIEYQWYPGDPGCRYTPNGDGWPPSGPEVEWEAKCVLLTFNLDEERRPTEEEAKIAKDWLEKDDDILYSRIYEEICTDVDERLEDNRW